MAKLRTFLDSGVLIAAARGNSDISIRAMSVLNDPNADFVVSDFLRLEVLPKAVYHKSKAEEQFYRAIFAAVRSVKTSARLVAEAEMLGMTLGLNALDALHVAAAIRASCTQMVTTERPTSPLSRVSVLEVLSIA